MMCKFDEGIVMPISWRCALRIFPIYEKLPGPDGVGAAVKTTEYGPTPAPGHMGPLARF